MGRLFVVELADSDDPHAHLLVCRTCHTHIAHRQDIFMPGRNLLRLSNAVNLQVDVAEEYKVHADVRCVKCGDLLGVKCIKDVRVPSGHIHIEGTYQLIREKLDCWKLAGQYRNVEPNDLV